METILIDRTLNCVLLYIDLRCLCSAASTMIYSVRATVEIILNTVYTNCTGCGFTLLALASVFDGYEHRQDKWLIFCFG